MKTKLLLLAACVCTLVSFSSAQVYSGTALQNSSGNVARIVPFAPVTVCLSTDTATPCTTKATLFTDATLGTPCSLGTGNSAPLSGTNCNNPGIADANGNFTFYAAPGNYRICTYAQNYQCITVPAGSSGVNCSAGTIAIPWFNGTTTLCDQNLTDDGAGNLGVVTLTASGGITTSQLNLNGGAGFLIGPMQKQTAPANNTVTSSQIVCWADVSTNLLACKNSDGSNAMPSSSGGTLTVQTNGVSNTSQTTLNFNNPATFNGLTFTYSNPSSGNETFAVGGTLNNAGLTNPSTTVNGQTCTLGSTCTISGSAPTVVAGSSDTLTAAGTFATQTSFTAGSTSFIEIRAHGVYTTTATAAPLFNMQVNAGGTTGICSHSGNITLGLSKPNNSWDVVCYVHILTTGAPGTATTWGLDEATISGTGTISQDGYSQGALSQAFTTTTSQTVSIQETATLVAGQSITLQSLIVRPY